MPIYVVFRAFAAAYGGYIICGSRKKKKEGTGKYEEKM